MRKMLPIDDFIIDLFRTKKSPKRIYLVANKIQGLQVAISLHTTETY